MFYCSMGLLLTDTEKTTCSESTDSDLLLTNTDRKRFSIVSNEACSLCGGGSSSLNVNVYIFYINIFMCRPLGALAWRQCREKMRT